MNIQGRETEAGSCFVFARSVGLILGRWMRFYEFLTYLFCSLLLLIFRLCPVPWPQPSLL